MEYKLNPATAPSPLLFGSQKQHIITLSMPKKMLLLMQQQAEKEGLSFTAYTARSVGTFIRDLDSLLLALLECQRINKVNVTQAWSMKMADWAVQPVLGAKDYLSKAGWPVFSTPRLVYGCLILQAIKDGILSADADAVDF